MKKQCGAVTINNEKNNRLKIFRSGSKINDFLCDKYVYITSDEEIKEGDWYYNDWTKTISKTNIDIKKCSDYFKIISSIDKSLNLPDPSL